MSWPLGSSMRATVHLAVAVFIRSIVIENNVPKVEKQFMIGEIGKYFVVSCRQQLVKWNRGTYKRHKNKEIIIINW
jgi:hypothetical protein